jgi:hypothetical protein
LRTVVGTFYLDDSMLLLIFTHVAATVPRFLNLISRLVNANIHQCKSCFLPRTRNLANLSANNASFIKHLNLVNVRSVQRRATSSVQSGVVSSQALMPTIAGGASAHYGRNRPCVIGNVFICQSSGVDGAPVRTGFTQTFGCVFCRA